jgi:signal peptidase I
MENTLLVDDWLFVTKALYGAEVPFTGRHLPAFREPRRGEIVVFKSVEGNFDVVKRLVGVRGDTLAMRHGRLIRNGVELVEPYVVHDDSTRSEQPAERDRMRRWQIRHLVGDTTGYRPDVQDWGPLVVPPDSFFMMGDNRDNSLDSRYWGLVPRGNIRGKPMFIYYSYDGTSWRSLPALTAIRWNHLFSQPR